MSQLLSYFDYLMEEKDLKYKRFENESDDELIYRVTGDKEQIGSWKDVADVLNELLGTDYGESTFRKKRQTVRVGRRNCCSSGWLRNSR